MGEQKRVVLYGNSVVLGCIGASLQRADRYQLIHVPVPLPGLSALERMAHDVVIFDAENGQPDVPFSLLKDRPDLVVISISPDGNIVRLWSAHQYRELSTTDLTALIDADSPQSIADDQHFAQASGKGTEG